MSDNTQEEIIERDIPYLKSLRSLIARIASTKKVCYLKTLLEKYPHIYGDKITCHQYEDMLSWDSMFGNICKERTQQALYCEACMEKHHSMNLNGAELTQEVLSLEKIIHILNSYFHNCMIVATLKEEGIGYLLPTPMKYFEVKLSNSEQKCVDCLKKVVDFDVLLSDDEDKVTYESCPYGWTKGKLNYIDCNNRMCECVTANCNFVRSLSIINSKIENAFNNKQQDLGNS